MGSVHADEPQTPQDPRGVFMGTLGRVHADRSPGLLRTHGEASGRCGAASSPAGAPGPSGHKLTLLAAGGRIHGDRSLVSSGPGVRLEEDVGPRPR